MSLSFLYFSALSEVEQLLASLSFKTYNQRAFETTLKRRYEIEDAKKLHIKSKYGTKLPYAGPNINNLCELQCEQLNKIKDSDLRMAKILRTYEETQRELAMKQIQKQKRSKKKNCKIYGLHSKKI